MKCQRTPHIVPVFRKNPDIQKLGRALIAISERIAKEHEQSGI